MSTKVKDRRCFETSGECAEPRRHHFKVHGAYGFHVRPSPGFVLRSNEVVIAPPRVLAIFFFACLNAFGLGVIGAHGWRTFENTKQGPQSIVLAGEQLEGALWLVSVGWRGVTGRSAWARIAQPEQE